MEEKGRIFIFNCDFLDQFFREAQQQPECFLLLHALRIVQSGTTFIAWTVRFVIHRKNQANIIK